MRASSERSASTARLRRGVFACVVAVLAPLAVVDQGCTEQSSPSAAPKPIVIGVSLGLTGDLDTFAAGLREAVRAAEGQINAAGGILGKPVFFDVKDDTGKPEGAERVAQEFVKNRVAAVIGPLGSQQVVRTQQIYAAARILQITPSATSTDLSEVQPTSDRNLFRTTPADNFQGAAVMLFADRTPRGIADAGAVPDAGLQPDADAGDAGTPAPAPDPPPTCMHLAVVHIDNAYGKSMADVIEQNYPKRSAGRTVFRRSVPQDALPDYTALVSEIIGATPKPECLAIIAYDPVAAQFVRDLKVHPGYPALEQKGFFVIGTDGIFTAGFISRASQAPSDPTAPNAAEGVFGTNPDTQPKTREYDEFRAIYSAYAPLGRKDAPAFSANTYDAALVVALAIQAAGTTERDSVRTEMLRIAGPPGKPITPAQVGEALQAIQRGEEIDYKGASGSVDFEANGNVKSGYIVWEAFRDPLTRKVGYRTVTRFTAEELLGLLK